MSNKMAKLREHAEEAIGNGIQVGSSPAERTSQRAMLVDVRGVRRCDEDSVAFAELQHRALRHARERQKRRVIETDQDLARRAQVHDLVTRAISGHATERMQRHYSTAQREEMLAAVDRVVSLFSADTERKRLDKDSSD